MVHHRAFEDCCGEFCCQVHCENYLSGKRVCKERVYEEDIVLLILRRKWAKELTGRTGPRHMWATFSSRAKDREVSSLPSYLAPLQKKEKRREDGSST